MTNLKVGKLKELLEQLPDDMDVIIPVIDEEDSNMINGFRHVRVAGVLSSPGEEDAFCLNTAHDDATIAGQLIISGRSLVVNCEKLLL